MSKLMSRLLAFMRNLFVTSVQEEEAWIDNEILTEREERVHRITRVFQWGAIAHALLIVLAGLIVALAGGDSVQGLLLANSGYEGQTAALLGMIGIFANLSLLLLLAVGTMAQEAWTAFLLVAGLVVNLAALVLLGFIPALALFVPLGYAIYLTYPDFGAFHGNPVSIKELRGRMRGVRSFAIISIFLILMSSFTLLLYLLRLPDVAGQRTISPGELGRELFRAIVGMEMLLVIFIVPALTAGAVTGERERKTYDLLQTTLLSAPAFLVGKMESALGYIILLLLSAIPLQSIAFLFGGVTETEVLVSFVMLTTTGLLLGALGLFFSAQTERTITATVRVYIVSLVLMFGLPAVSFFVFRSAFGNAVNGVAPAQGLSATAESALVYADMLVSSLNPITAAFYSQTLLIDYQQISLHAVQLSSTGTTIPIVAPWIILSGSYIALSAFLIAVAVRRMRRSRGG